VKTGEFLNSDMTQNHDSCSEVYANSDMYVRGDTGLGDLPVSGAEYNVTSKYA